MSNDKQQIEEMAKVLCEDCANDTSPCRLTKEGRMCDAVMEQAEALYNAGYRKQSEGEWIEHIEKPSWWEDDVEVFYECSVCNTQSPAPTKYCPNCGAKMKGGAE